MLMNWWGLFALDYCEDKIPDDYIESEDKNNIYWDFVRFVISEELTKHLPNWVIENSDNWVTALDDT